MNFNEIGIYMILERKGAESQSSTQLQIKIPICDFAYTQ